MEDSSKKSESKNEETYPPPYEGVVQEVTLAAPTPPPNQDPAYPGLMQGSGQVKPPYSGGIPEVQTVNVVQTQRIVRVNHPPDPPIQSYLACSILVLIFCCLPFGIVALVYAVQVRSRETVGDFQGARQASSQAKLWTYLGFFTGLVILIGVIVWIAIAY